MKPRHYALFEMRIKTLLRRSESEDPEESLAAKRVLERIFVHTGFYMPRDFREPGDYPRSELCLKIATQIKPSDPRAWYSLAQVQSIMGHPRSALESLRRAIDSGFSRVDLLSTDPEFQSLQKKPEFEALVKSIQ